jgi:oligopeptide transport system substrate-binding protein
VLTDDPAAEYKRFRAGDLDLTETVPTGPVEPLRERHGAALKIAPYLGMVYFGFNLRLAPFRDDPNLRRALNLALDREILARHIAGAGESPSFVLVPPALLAPPVESARRARLDDVARVAEARAALAASRYRVGESPPIEIRFNANPSQRRLALAIQAMWLNTLSVRSQIRQEEWKVFLSNRKQGRLTQVFRMSWVADVGTAENFLALFASDSPMNYVGWRDRDFDDALLSANAAADEATRAAALARAQARLIDADVILPLYQYVSRHLVAPRVQGWTNHPLDRHLSRHLWLQAR